LDYYGFSSAVLEVEMRFSREAVNQYMNLKAVEQAFEKDRKRLQTGYRVFVSYSSIDEAAAQNICGILSELGIEFFFDRKDIHWGQEVVPGVSGGLRSSTHLIVVVSPASLIREFFRKPPIEWHCNVAVV